MLPYHNPVPQDDLTLSIDNVVLDFELPTPAKRNCLMNLMDILPIRYTVEVVHWNSFRPGTFKEQFSIRMSDGTSFWVGAALVSTSTLWGRCRMEFNPNKVASHDVFNVVLGFFLENTRPILRKIARFDLAVDIPIPRHRCFLVKDMRLYIERRHGQEYTQYLGAKSSAVGRVKLYNKQVESKLSEPLTRLELTLDPNTPYEKIRFPSVFCLDSTHVDLDGKRVTDTERFILNALLQGYGTLNDLGRKTRAKMDMLMTTCVRRIDITAESYATILQQLQVYLNGTRQEVEPV